MSVPKYLYIFTCVLVGYTLKKGAGRVHIKLLSILKTYCYGEDIIQDVSLEGYEKPIFYLITLV